MTVSLRFGVFPLGLAGGPGGVACGPPDDFGQIERAFVRLRGDGPPLLVRMYVSWSGAASTAIVLNQVRELVTTPLNWDLVLCYRDAGGDVDGWESFVARVVTGYGRQIAAIQVTGEANLRGIPAAADGAFPRALETVLRAVHTRRDELNVTHWELFTLRDADSSNGDMFHQFGVLRDDYTPKPAFERLRCLFAELSRPAQAEPPRPKLSYPDLSQHRRIRVILGGS